MKVGYQGIQGAYSEAAARILFPNADSISGFPTFEAIFASVQNNTLDYGVVPIENSLAGSIHKNIDLLRKHDLKIVGETYLKVQHNLLAIEGTNLETISEVYSHPQALAQCASTIAQLLPNAKIREYFDTAGAAQYVADSKDTSKAAIASNRAAEEYKLAILKTDIQDDPNNFTRFVVIHKGLEALPMEAKAKTSIIFSGNSVPGFLYKVLEPLAKHNINITKIESRPIPDKTWHYFFYLDFDGNAADPQCATTLAEMKTYAPDLKVLGTYQTTPTL